MGVLETLQTAGTVVLAAPIALLGVALLADGRVMGAVFLAFAVLLVVLQYRLTTPSDLPVVAAERTVESVVASDDDEE